MGGKIYTALTKFEGKKDRTYAVLQNVQGRTTICMEAILDFFGDLVRKSNFTGKTFPLQTSNLKRGPLQNCIVLRGALIGRVSLLWDLFRLLN